MEILPHKPPPTPGKATQLPLEDSPTMATLPHKPPPTLGKTTQLHLEDSLITPVNPTPHLRGRGIIKRPRAHHKDTRQRKAHTDNRRSQAVRIRGRTRWDTKRLRSQVRRISRRDRHTRSRISRSKPGVRQEEEGMRVLLSRIIVARRWARLVCLRRVSRRQGIIAVVGVVIAVIVAVGLGTIRVISGVAVECI